ncbi:diguanylate cyclase [Alkalimonas collagenimarina]|uniref:Diguanylate cyclase n=1 Tax=Alkalimonas collagenimarina TaxID=400390 RepID=A0ABT9H0V7_9GAMM|nr:sensor domain-containing diguanylate cyclase [Alkalimonas collagenimarina]MDP4536952.1 diguanylate cyclase [Alkalimonas collagenimarina]
MRALHRKKAAQLPSLQRIYIKTTLLVLLISVVSLAIIIGSIGMNKLTAFAQMNLQLVARSTAVTIEAAVFFDDKEIVAEQLAHLLSDADVANAQITLQNGEHYLNWKLNSPTERSRLSEQLIHWLLQPESAPIVMQQEPIAEITLWPQGERILLFMSQGLISLLFSLGLTLALLLWGTRHLHHLMSKPLLELATVTSKVRAERDFSQRVSRSKIAEIDQLRIDFNALLDELNQWQTTVEAAHSELQQHAYYDSLTGIRNRSFFESALKSAVERAKRQSGELSILYIDGDGFKAVNDTYGHAAGDEVIKNMACRIQQNLRSTDLIARLGGDEFCVLIDAAESPEHIDQLCEKIIAQVSQPMTLPDQSIVNVSVSIGVACFPIHGHSVEELLHAADTAMYQVKRSGRNGYNIPQS